MTARSERTAVVAALSDPFLGLDFFAREFGVSVDHLQNISLAQRGLAPKSPFSARGLRRYPTFIQGPGGRRLGLYESQYRQWREEQRAPLPRRVVGGVR